MGKVKKIKAQRRQKKLDSREKEEVRQDQNMKLFLFFVVGIFVAIAIILSKK